MSGFMVRQGFISRILNWRYAGFVVMIGFSDPMHVRTIVEDVLRKLKEMERVQEDLKALEKEYEFGRISREKYEELKKKCEEKLKSL